MGLPVQNPHNLGSVDVQSTNWAGITMHSIDHQVLSGPAWHEISSSSALLSIVVEQTGGHCEARSTIGPAAEPCRARAGENLGHISLIPAGYAVWGYSDGIARVLEARMVLDEATLFNVTGGEFPNDLLTRPRLMFLDDKLQTMARLLTREHGGSLSSALLGDGLMSAILARLADLTEDVTRKTSTAGLTPKQLAIVKDFIVSNLAQTVRFADLAAFTGLSQSQFGRAFKASTGTSPHKWHLDARLQQAKSMLADKRWSLVDIALATGFSEQSHFNRIFRAATGITPGAWRRTRLN